MFLWRNKKKYWCFLNEKKSLIWSFVNGQLYKAITSLKRPFQIQLKVKKWKIPIDACLKVDTTAILVVTKNTEILKMFQIDFPGLLF